MRAIIYLRVSTVQQKESRAGLKLQLKQCKQIAARLHVHKKHIFEDAATSGFVAIEQRPGLTAALQMLEPGDVFLVASRDRLARDVVIAIQIERIIEKCGAALLCAQDDNISSAQSLFARRKSDIKAELVRERIKKATLKSINKKRKLFNPYGTIPYGYKIERGGNVLVACKKEQAVIAHVIQLREQERSLREIVQALDDAGYRSRTKQPFQVTQVVNILKEHTRQHCTVTIDRSAPYGFKRSDHGFEIHPAEQIVVNLVKQLHRDNYSLRAIAYILNSKKYYNRAGNKFHATQVVRIIARF